MTKAMIGMVVSVLAIAEYLDNVYWSSLTAENGFILNFDSFNKNRQKVDWIYKLKLALNLP